MRKRADELVTGDVLLEPFLKFQRVLAVRQWSGWVSVDFDPVGSKAFSDDELVEVE